MTPQLFDLFWKVTANPLTGPAIQTGPLSETDPLRVVTTDNRNYIQWLHEWARLSFDTIRVQDGFQGGQWPNALLFILLRHALELGYYDAGIRVLDDAQLLGDEQKAQLRTEPHFFHVQEAAASRAGRRGRRARRRTPAATSCCTPRIPRSPATRACSLADFLTSRIGDLFGTRYLIGATARARETRAHADRAARAPHGRAPRLLHVSARCVDDRARRASSSPRCATRGAATARACEEGAPHRKGIYVGAYGWLENVRPDEQDADARASSKASSMRSSTRQTPGGVPLPPIVRDDANQGYIHAPSVNHAVTAAVLRNGYVANATPAQPDLLKVNLSSERVRRALRIIEGIRGGQSLAALLGYEFERGLHDRYQMAECDRSSIRCAWCSRSTPRRPRTCPRAPRSRRSRRATSSTASSCCATCAARRRRIAPIPSASRIPTARRLERRSSDAIDDEVDRLLDLYDAVADLAVAEGVHQVVMGNYDRAAATLDAYGQATFPPIPDVVQTPRSGIVLTHRVGLQFDAGATSAATDNPRVKAEPAMNRWVGTVLPPPARIGCKVRYLDPAGAEQVHVRDAGRSSACSRSICVYVLDPDNLQSAREARERGSDADLGSRSELDDRVREFVLRQPALAVRPDLLREISYFEGNAGRLLVRRRRADGAQPARAAAALAAAARHGRRAADGGEDRRPNPPPRIERTRVDFLPGDLADERDNRLAPLKTELDAAFPDAGPVVATVVADIDDWLDRMIAACRVLARIRPAADRARCAARSARRPHPPDSRQGEYRRAALAAAARSVRRC